MSGVRRGCVRRRRYVAKSAVGTGLLAYGAMPVIMRGSDIMTLNLSYDVLCL